jgi:nitrate/nitrite transporter NarK
MLNLHRRMKLLMVTALMVATTGVTASAASGTGYDWVSCIDQDKSASEAGARGQAGARGPMGPLAEQHAQEMGDLQAFGEEASVVISPPGNHC